MEVKNEKNIIFVALSTFLLLGLTGCGSSSNKMQTFAFQPDNITEIQVNTGVAPVSLVKSSDDSIEMNFTQEIAVVENGVLKVNTPEQKGAIHIKKRQQ